MGSQFEEMVADVYDIYERDLHRMNAMDFDDLLFRTVNLLELFEEVRERYTSAFRHVLVDEYQDTNHAQYRLLAAARRRRARRRGCRRTRRRRAGRSSHLRGPGRPSQPGGGGGRLSVNLFVQRG